MSIQKVFKRLIGEIEKVRGEEIYDLETFTEHLIHGGLEQDEDGKYFYTVERGSKRESIPFSPDEKEILSAAKLTQEKGESRLYRLGDCEFVVRKGQPVWTRHNDPQHVFELGV